MKTLDVIQGSNIWHQARADHFCASEAAAAMGKSKYQSRAALLHQKFTGLTPEVGGIKQRLFDEGHAAEAAARPLVEELLSQELFPCVAVAEIDGLKLLASFDGIVMDESIVWETKQYNQALAAALADGDLPDTHWPQLEHQFLVSDAQKAYFTTTDGTAERMVGIWYVSKPERRAAVLAAWKQFAKDLAEYVPPEAAPAVTAAAVLALPAVSVRVEGELAITSNLPEFGEKLVEFIGKIPKKPSTDQDFADAVAAIKTLEKAEAALDQAESAALAQASSVDELRRTVALLCTRARTARLALTKLVDVRKEEIKVEIKRKGESALAEHIAALNKRLARVTLPPMTGDFAVVMKGKKGVTGLQDAVDTELARMKIYSNAVADKYDANLKVLAELGADHAFLFNDLQQIVSKDADDFKMLINSRIDHHKASEAKRLEEQRARIRQEELDRIERDRVAEAVRVQREADEAESLRQADVPESAPGAAIKPQQMTPTGMRRAPITIVQAPTRSEQGKPIVTPIKIKRPSDAEIVKALVLYFGVHEMIVLGWIGTVDLVEYAKEFS